MKLSRKDFSSAEEYKEYLTTEVSIKVLPGLINCQESDPETLPSADKYDTCARKAIRYAKAFVKQLKIQ